VGGGAVVDLNACFLRPVAVGGRLSVRWDETVAGRFLRHRRIDAWVDGRVAVTGTAVVGRQPGPVGTAGPPAPVPPPEDCPERTYAGPGTGVAALLDVRRAGESVDAGVASRVLLWVRTRCPAPDVVRLAVASDHVPYLLRRMDPGLARVLTVSASLRVLDGDVDEWILADVSVVARGPHAAVGRVALWSAGTRLVGVAEQTTMVKGPLKLLS
jgi:acyl-CoA thioesterase